MKLSAVILLTLLAAAWLAGCTPQEKQNLSPIPQNRPTNWELNPYGSMRN